MKLHARHKGYTLVELLIVMAIIVLMTGIVVPTLVQSGFFSSDKSRTGARDLFAQLRAATLHARTHNTAAAIAYDVELIQDSLYDGDGLAGTNTPRSFVPAAYTGLYPEVADPNWVSARPVLTQTLLVRQLTIDELKQTDTAGVSLAQRIIEYDINDEYAVYADVRDDRPFVPANSTYAQFEDLPAETALLINHPDTLQTNGAATDLTNFLDKTALSPIAIFFVSDEEGIFDVLRALPKENDGDLTDTVYVSRGLPDPSNAGIWNNRFPAHVFDKSGALDNPSSSGIQRIQLKVGAKPDVTFYDRYIVDEQNDDMILTNEDFYGTNVKLPNEDLVGIDTEITIFAPTGRVVVEGDDGT